MKLAARFAQISRSFATRAQQQCTEIQIPVPWGHIAAKWWGPGKNRPILALHGWQDNSGTFDTLFPLLPEHVEFLAVDLPGHGFSSPIPSGINYYHMDGVILLRRLQKYFGWSQISLLGHSMGAMTSFMFATTYPKDVDLLVCIDGFRPLIIKNLLEKRPLNIDNFLKYDAVRNFDAKRRPSYPMEVMEKLWHEGSRKSIDLDKCRYILKRNVAQAHDDPEKYYLTIDPRLKVGPLVNYPQDEVLESAKGLKMPLLLIRANQKIYFQDMRQFEEVADMIKAINPKYEKYTVDGTHHVHLNHPERVQGHISEFLNKYYQEEQNSFAVRQANL